jgi:hypothetical protein
VYQALWKWFVIFKKRKWATCTSNVNVALYISVKAYHSIMVLKFDPVKSVSFIGKAYFFFFLSLWEAQGGISSDCRGSVWPSEGTL